MKLLIHFSDINFNYNCNYINENNNKIKNNNKNNLIIKFKSHIINNKISNNIINIIIINKNNTNDNQFKYCYINSLINLNNIYYTNKLDLL